MDVSYLNQMSSFIIDFDILLISIHHHLFFVIGPAQDFLAVEFPSLVDPSSVCSTSVAFSTL